uniref:Uncharacterized protein n=1 Tax=Setaria digitata TaxID=48799 RepID=A0A915Q6Q6_9BILA
MLALIVSRPKDTLSLEKRSKNDVKKHSSTTSLIDTYSHRRRPVISSTLEDIRCNTLQKGLENQPLKKPENVNFHQIIERVEKLRKQLEKTMNNLPNQSPRKSLNFEDEKDELLSESRKLAGACKTMVSAVHDSGNQKKWSQILGDVLQAAERVTYITERMIQKSNSIFQAQLMTTKTEQMLKSLVEVLYSLEEMQSKNGDSKKLLTTRSTTLTANIRQLISTVQQP